MSNPTTLNVETTDLNGIPFARINLDDLMGCGLIERAKCFQQFLREGISLQTIGRVCGLDTHAVEDHVELVNTPLDLATLLNRSPLNATMALMLAHRFTGWIKTGYASHALPIARRLLEHAHKEQLTLKSWRYLLDFYWSNDRPFLM